MIPVVLPESNLAIAYDQDEYEPLSAYKFENDEQGRIAFCFRLSDAEIKQLCETRSLWVEVLTFGHKLQPIRLSTERPSDLPP